MIGEPGRDNTFDNWCPVSLGVVVFVIYLYLFVIVFVIYLQALCRFQYLLYDVFM